MRKLAFGSIALLALTARAATASDLPPPAPAPVYRPSVVAPVFSWSGCYAGGNVGGGWANTHAYDTNGVLTGAAGAPVLNGDLGSQTASGVIGGGQIGCDYQIDKLVVGVQGMFDGSGMSASTAQPGGLFTTDTSILWFGTLTARAGLAVLPTGLLYVKGGAAWMKDNFSATVTPTGAALLGAPAGVAANVGFNASGWTIGGGFEWAFANAWSAFAEYDYLDFGTPSVNFASPGTLLPTTFPLSVRQNVSVFMVGLNARFGPAGY